MAIRFKMYLVTQRVKIKGRIKHIVRAHASAHYLVTDAHDYVWPGKMGRFGLSVFVHPPVGSRVSNQTVAQIHTAAKGSRNA